MIVTLNPGDVLQVQFAETDGAFEIHFDSQQHPNAIIVKETDGLRGNILGEAATILYEERFGLPLAETLGMLPPEAFDTEYDDGAAGADVDDEEPEDLMMTPGTKAPNPDDPTRETPPQEDTRDRKSLHKHMLRAQDYARTQGEKK